VGGDPPRGTEDLAPVTVEVGSEAPDFALPNQFRQTIRLSDYRGNKNVVLVFYPLAFTPTCTGEICAIRDEGAALSNDAAQVLAVSCDPTSALRVFSDQQGVTYPLLSDFWPHGEVSRRYGVFVEERGFAMRATFVIDKQGVVRWSVVHPGGEPRDPQEYEKALAALT
jgi:mycoredoxin-dependent peroxiredoxin